jgi:hypothetical protein
MQNLTFAIRTNESLEPGDYFWDFNYKLHYNDHLNLCSWKPGTLNKFVTKFVFLETWYPK